MWQRLLLPQKDVSPDEVAHPRLTCERIRLRLSPLWCGSFASLPAASPAALLTSLGAFPQELTHMCFPLSGTVCKDSNLRQAALSEVEFQLMPSFFLSVLLNNRVQMPSA